MRPRYPLWSSNRSDLEPLDEADRVEVTLVTDAATYEKLAPKLDALVAKFDLVPHVRRVE